ncbi:SIS domain-containing protein [Candidatus Kaiserbacteria bacterium]|nr:SIS domain-containing protein [Candidatus Kaiserbacteria bacterium]
MKAEDVLKDALRRHQDVVLKTDTILEHAARGADMLASALKEGKKVLACGNGGSAADAEHFVGELLCRYKDDRRALPGISLLFPVGALTAIANDYSFDDVFARQVDALGATGDILVALTTSGRSKNVLAALGAARKKGLVTIVLTGAKGGTLADAADLVVAVPSEETARIQEMHELIYHGWCEYLDTLPGIRK